MYDNRLNNLLIKYDLFHEFDFNVKKLYEEVIKTSLDKKKKYLLCGDMRSTQIWVCMNKLSKMCNVMYIAKEYLGKCDDTQISGVEIRSLKNINECEFDEIIICSYNKDLIDTEKLKSIYPKKQIIFLYEKVPSYARSFYWSHCNNIIYEYIRKRECCISVDLKNDLSNFNYVIDKHKEKLGEQLETIIWGGGVHTITLLNNTKMAEMLNVKYIVDKNTATVGGKVNGIEIISFDKLKDIKFNTFFISSYAYKEEIKLEIKEKYPEKSYIDIYEKYDYSILTKIKLDKELINSSKRSEIIKELFIVYLAIRDFDSAEKYLKDYIDNKYSGYNMYSNFLKELQQILLEMKQEINNFKNSNIHFMLIDSLDKYAFDNYMPNMNKSLKQSIKFDKAYSGSTFTTESHICMFNETNLFSNKEFIKREKIKQCEFIDRLKEHGYSICGNNVITVAEDLFENNIGDKDEHKPITLMLWENICFRVSNGDRKNFIYYRPMEYHDDSFKDLKMSINYIDNQIKYYNQFFNKKDYFILTADHGKTFPEIEERRIHIPLLIKTPDCMIRNYKQLFSTVNIGKLILEVIENKLREDENTSYVIIERFPIYNYFVRDGLKNKGLEKYTTGFRVIHKINEKYIIFGDGTEEYYYGDDEKTNLILNKEYKTNIDEFRKIHLNNLPEYDICNY